MGASQSEQTGDTDINMGASQSEQTGDTDSWQILSQCCFARKSRYNSSLQQCEDEPKLSHANYASQNRTATLNEALVAAKKAGLHEEAAQAQAILEQDTDRVLGGASPAPPAGPHIHDQRRLPIQSIYC
jgi:hypothetical protein